jgi:hypothetical protein
MTGINAGGPNRRRGPDADRRRARVLAASPDGCTEANTLATGSPPSSWSSCSASGSRP